NLKRALGQIARLQNAPGINDTNDDINCVFLEPLQLSRVGYRNKLTVDVQRIETLPFRPTPYLGMETFARLDQRSENFEATAFGRRFDFFYDGCDALLFDRQITIRTKLGA